MKITKIETVRVGEYKCLLWVRIFTNEGHIGLGETWYGARTVEAAIHELFAPQLIGRDPLHIEGHWNNMFRLADHWGYGGAEMRAISALDIALWDIAGQANGRPIYELLGGACRDRIRVYNTGAGPEYPANPVPYINSLLERGINAMKVGVFPTDHRGDGYYSSNGELENIIAPIRAIRDAVGDRMKIALDGHGFWDFSNAVRLARLLEPYDILWIEELMSPRNVKSYVRLAEQTSIPVCLSERLMTRYQYREFIESGAMDIVMPDLIWTGGISETRKIAILAETYQLPVCPHDSTGPVNVFACNHICMTAPNAMMMETTASSYETWYGDFVTPNLVIEDGCLLAPEGPGLGTKLRPEVFERSDVSVMLSDKSDGHYMGWLQ